MRWCVEKGIPHSVLLEWDPEDRAKLHAYLLEEAQRCVLCGTQPWEWDLEQGGSKRAYIPVNVFCHGCYAKHALQEDNEAPPGTTIQLVPYSTQVVEQQRKAYERALKEKTEERRGRAVHRRAAG